ncbi:MAG: SMP-30/gluconolactonase/LRE family protein [Verrucomicrobia bacterium]|nr:SMP-30/gluconolactonase/LRE family protein [Verrucomicrobiota bacterium]MBI3869507.1 SMP-30/gluconolactonase/LRE family protein [Verrucomicrobiota bacterium]
MRTRLPAARLLLGLGLFLVAQIQKAAEPRLFHPIDHGKMDAGEGPVWHPDGYLLFSGDGKIHKRDDTGRTSVFRDDAQSNGMLLDQQGRLVVCESGRRRVTRTELGGTITILADHYEGHRFNTPNDLSIDSQGRVYFTDPRYGPREDMEMKDQDGRLVEGVYRIDAPGKVARIISHEVERPNGILVSPDDQFLYVADNNNNNIGGARKLWRFGLRADVAIDPSSRKLIFDWKGGRGPDGFKIDQKGRLYVAAGLNIANPPYETSKPLSGGVYVLSPEGKLQRFVPILNDEVTNCAFGGEDLRTLFVTAGGHLWSFGVPDPGWARFSKSKSAARR